MYVKTTNRNEFLACCQALMNYNAKGDGRERSAVRVQEDRRRARAELSAVAERGVEALDAALADGADPRELLLDLFEVAIANGGDWERGEKLGLDLRSYRSLHEADGRMQRRAIR